MFSVKSEKYTESTYHDLFSLTCLYKYLYLQTIPTNMKVGSAEMFHKTIELALSHMSFGYKGIWFDSKFGKIPMKKFILNFVFILMKV